MQRVGLLLLFIFTLTFITAFKDKPAYKLFTKTGKETTYKNFLNQLKSADVVLFGELHNNPICHWLELSTLKDVPHEKIIVGAEMFESEDQDAINKYLGNKISLEEFEKGADLWKNFYTDYLPMMEYCKEHQIPFIATNCPRRYAKMVSKKGIKALDSISSHEKEWIAPLPLEVDLKLPGYQNMMKEGLHGMSMWNNEFMGEAQAIKDATMAHFIFTNLTQGKTFIHFNGSYHSDNFEGIYWYLKRKNPNLKIITISTVEQEKISILEKHNQNRSDFTVAVPEDMTKTY